MKKFIKYFTLLMITLFTLSVLSCREKTTGEKIEDGVEEVGDGIEEGVEEVEDEIDDATDN